MTISSGIVVIGRNEGQRLERCLDSLDGVVTVKNERKTELEIMLSAVYVDSGSTDGSQHFARKRGIAVVRLEQPYTAARARNAGFLYVMEQNSTLEYVQFLDGDSAISPEWIGNAVEFLNRCPNCAAVCGNLSERYPDASIYNRLCQMEWEKNPGPIQASGGIFMVRAKAFRQIGGFAENVVAAEDDEFCLRLRQQGWTIHFLDEKMAVHDAAMTHFSQWWRRAHRAGLAYANGNYLHGRTEGLFVREVRSMWIWGLIVPILATVFGWWTNGWGFTLFLAYPALILKVYRYGVNRGWSRRDSAIYAFFTVLSKLPGILGMLRFWIRQALSIQPRIIEHKLSKTR